MSISTNKTINFTNRNVVSFIFKECDFSLLKIARQAYSSVYGEYNFSKQDEKIIEIPINALFKEAVNTEAQNTPLKSKESLIKAKSTIENICNCLIPIAKMNGNRFVYKNLDLKLFIDKTIFSRSRPFFTKSSIVSLCVMRTISCSIIGPASSSVVT